LIENLERSLRCGDKMNVSDNEIVKIKRQASGAWCASIFSVIISLVSIIFALDVYIAMVTEGICL
jgi:hypothetical protein